MSILSDTLSDLGLLFFPRRCPICGEPLSDGVEFICPLCQIDAPLTGYSSRADNPLFESFWGQLPIERATSLLFFRQGSGWQQLIHDFKYRNRWRYARYMGQWLGAEIARGELYGDVDIIIPIPLHPLKRLRRGYNQSEHIALGLSQRLGVEVDFRSVVRLRNNKSQTRHHRRDRWENVKELFWVRKPEQLAGKHILLVDDVLTTGATMVSCGEAILSQVPSSRLSVASIACLEE